MNGDMNATEKVILTGIDVHGIQQYLFASGKLREIVGASALVDAASTQWPREIAEQVMQLERVPEPRPGDRWYLPARMAGGALQIL